MRGPKPPSLSLTPAQQQALQALVNRPSMAQQIALRGRIVLLCAEGHNNSQIARLLACDIRLARLWRQRWLALQDTPDTEMNLTQRLSDAPRPGAPATISAEAYCQIMALACQPPQDCGRPIAAWSARELAEEAVAQGIVERISPRQVGRFLKRGGH